MAAAPPTSGFAGADKPEYADYSRCVHCGLCLNHCPTYKLWGQEADSPRGRIRQMQLVDEGRLALGDAFVTHIDRCLDCRACETACPSGVEYGKLVEAARTQIEQHYRRPLASRLARDFVYRKLLPYPRRIAPPRGCLRLYQRSGLAGLAREHGHPKATRLAGTRATNAGNRLASFSSTTSARRFRLKARVARASHSSPACVAQVTFSELNRATIRVLQANGCEVVVPPAQVCCGALPSHAGIRDVARDLARANFTAFQAGECDAIITNAAGCGSTLKEYSHLFAAGAPEHETAVRFAGKMRDVSEFLAELGLVAPMKTVPLRVTYQDSCHLAHGQKDPRGAAQINSRRSRRGIRRDGAGGPMLRVGRCVQRY